MNTTTIAVDLAKSVFEVAVSEQPGRIVDRQRLTRSQFSRFLAERQPATILMEACGTAHFWARLARDLGHTPILLPPHATRPYITRNKTDRADAKGILEAYRNEDLHPVPVKSVPQQALMALHRVRSAWVSTRTARMNTARGILREFGIVIPIGSRRVVPRLHELVGDPDSGLPVSVTSLLQELAVEIESLDGRIRGVETQLKGLGAQTPAVERLESVPGIGVLTATALVAFVGDVQRFRTGRHFASYLGLTPKETSSGWRRRLGAISKKGNVYLRMLLTHGARSALCHAKKAKSPTHLQAWALKLESSRGHNKATIALANKIARVAWAVWRGEKTFEQRAA